jgi:hypothetical protein
MNHSSSSIEAELDITEEKISLRYAIENGTVLLCDVQPDEE